MNQTPFDADDFLSRLDLGAIEDASNKVSECEFFLSLAESECRRSQFRWLISAFLNAAYSYFEMTALRAYFAFADENGNLHPNDDSIEVLQGHVRVLRDQRRPDFVKTAGLSPLTSELYKIRRHNTHHHPLAIMQAGSSLPADFHFGHMRGDGTPVLPFCREVLALIHSVQRDLAL